MITIEEYASHDGLGLAQLVVDRQVTPAELVAAALRAIEKVNPIINAVLQTFPNQSAAELNHAMSATPFTGVPFLIKEMLLHAANVPCNMGSRLTEGYTLAEDSELMKRFRRAGLLLVGTTQTPEFAYGPTTEPQLYGKTRNPWDVNRIAGGSSGGSCAAVAAGIVPIAHGNDGGGSIRHPASCNGLVGLKPTRDRVPSGPNIADPTCGMTSEFAVTRSVRDAAALLDTISGADVGAPGMLPAPERPYIEELSISPSRLRIAWTATSPSGDPVEPEVAKAVQNTVKLLAELGHDVAEDSPKYEWEPYLQSLHVIFCSCTAAAIDGLAAALKRTPGPHNLEVGTLACYEDGKKYTAVDVLNATAHGNLVSRKVGQWFQNVDVFVCPTDPRVPTVLGELDQNRANMTAMEWSRQVFAYVPFTPIFNTTGQPAISLPLHWTPDGIPVGVQFAARFGDEATLFRLSSQLEQALPWTSRRPAVHAGALKSENFGVHI